MSLIQIVLFRKHAVDPLSWLITEETDTEYTHAAIVTDRSKNEISEAYAPHVRRRVLASSELAGIDVFDIVGLTQEQSDLILAECAKREAALEPYSIANLFRFNPVFRGLLGQAVDDGSPHAHLICSQYDLDCVKAAGIVLLNAPSYQVDPGHIAWSPLVKLGEPLKS
jgi:hypothetical protein